MDAALALHLRSVGSDPVTGQVKLPESLPAQAIDGRGGSACTTENGLVKEYAHA